MQSNDTTNQSPESPANSEKSGTQTSDRPPDAMESSMISSSAPRDLSNIDSTTVISFEFSCCLIMH